MKHLFFLVLPFLLFSCVEKDRQVDLVNSVLPLEEAATRTIEPVQEELPPLPQGVFAYYPTAGMMVLSEAECLTVFFTQNRHIWQEIPLQSIHLRPDGWYRVAIMGQEYTPIKGANFFDLLSPEGFECIDYCICMGTPIFSENEPSKYAKFGIASVSASSTLQEDTANGVFRYSSDYLTKLYYTQSLAIQTYWDANHHPWVEGEPGPGIGVTLDISFTEPSDHLVVLNGYVDPRKRDLFKANNRVKRARLESLDAGHPFSIEYSFNDAVEFSRVAFPVAVSAVRLEILEVYPGEKYDDTAISAILRDHTWTLSPERVNRIFGMKTPENRYQGQ